ncbi:MAG: hydrogenase expression/formation protein HypE [bacterium]
MINTIKLAHGSGGREMGELIKFIRGCIPFTGDWECTDEDSAVLKSANLRGCEPACLACASRAGRRESTQKNIPLTPHPSDRSVELASSKERGFIAFTTDTFVVDPIFFAGGNIGDLAFNGTLNDLLVQGAEPLGISLALVLEEGFLFTDLGKILKSISKLSGKVKVPIATGDTKVVPKGAIDKIMITTSGIGIVKNILSDKNLKPGDKIIASGTLGDHGAALLANRFKYKTNLKSDTKPLLNEIKSVKDYLTSAKDPTRGGIAAVLNEMAKKSKIKIILDEEKIPIKKETMAIAKLLGINKHALASEGRFVAGVSQKHVKKVINELKKFNKNAIIMGEVVDGEGVYIKNKLGEKRLDIPEGILIPRIC